MKNNKRKRRMINVLNDTALRMDYAKISILGQNLSYDALINYMIDLLENINRTEDNDNTRDFEFFKNNYTCIGETDAEDENFHRKNK